MVNVASIFYICSYVVIHLPRLFNLGCSVTHSCKESLDSILCAVFIRFSQSVEESGISDWILHLSSPPLHHTHTHTHTHKLL